MHEPRDVPTPRGRPGAAAVTRRSWTLPSALAAVLLLTACPSTAVDGDDVLAPGQVVEGIDGVAVGAPEGSWTAP